MNRWTIRRNDDGTLNEVCGLGQVHLEQMGDDEWSLVLDAPIETPGSVCRIWISGALGWPLWRDPEAPWWRRRAWEWVGVVRVTVTAEVDP